MINTRTIVTKIIETGAIRILTEYVSDLISSFMFIADTTVDSNNTIIEQGHLAYVNYEDLNVDFYINNDGRLIVEGLQDDVDKLSVSPEGHLIYTE